MSASTEEHENSRWRESSPISSCHVLIFGVFVLVSLPTLHGGLRRPTNSGVPWRTYTGSRKIVGPYVFWLGDGTLIAQENPLADFRKQAENMMVDPKRCIYYARKGTLKPSGKGPFILTRTDNLKRTTNFGRAVQRYITIPYTEPTKPPGANILCTLDPDDQWCGVVWGKGKVEGALAAAFRTASGRYNNDQQCAMVVSGTNHGVWVSGSVSNIAVPEIRELVTQHRSKSRKVSVRLGPNNQVMVYAGGFISQLLLVEDKSKFLLGTVNKITLLEAQKSALAASKKNSTNLREATKFSVSMKNWPFMTSIPKGFRLIEESHWEGRTLWILKGRSFMGFTDTILVVRAGDLPGRGILGKCKNVGIWVAEIASGIPVGTSGLKCEAHVVPNIKWNQPIIGLRSGKKSPYIQFRRYRTAPESKLGSIRRLRRNRRTAGQRPVQITSLSATVLEADPDWLVVAAAGIGGSNWIGDAVDRLCTDLKEEIKRLNPASKRIDRLNPTKERANRERYESERK